MADAESIFLFRQRDQTTSRLTNTTNFIEQTSREKKAPAHSFAFEWLDAELRSEWTATKYQRKSCLKRKKLKKIRTRNIQERKTSHRSQMEADSTWYVYKYLGPANCSTAFYLRPHFNQKEKRSRRFRRAEFPQVGNGDDIEPNGQTGQPIELVNQRSWIVQTVVLFLTWTLA